MRDYGTLACGAKASSGHLEETGGSACNEAPEVCPLQQIGPDCRRAVKARAAASDSRLPALAGHRAIPDACQSACKFAGRMPPESVLRAAFGGCGDNPTER
jgi:hypothetical protein